MHLPFYLQNSGLRKVKQAQQVGGEVVCVGAQFPMVLFFLFIFLFLFGVKLSVEFCGGGGDVKFWFCCVPVFGLDIFSP